MDPELVRTVLGPLLTALVTGVGVALKQAWESRDARQRARRHLQEASATMAFMGEWATMRASVGPEDAEPDLARVRADLERMYDQVLADWRASQRAAAQPSVWSLRRIVATVIALRIRVPAPPAPATGTGPASITASTTGSTAAPATDTYRRPIGAARVARPLYWLALGWALVWTAASFAIVPTGDDEYGNLWGAIAVALILTLVGAVLPAAALRALVLALDERAVRQRQEDAAQAQAAEAAALQAAQAGRFDGEAPALAAPLGTRLPGQPGRIVAQGVPEQGSPARSEGT